MSPSHDKQRSSSSTRILPESITKRKKILSFFSDRQSTTTVSGSISSLPKLTSSTSATSSHITTATTNSTTTISPLVRITLDNVDCHYLRKTLSKFQNKIKQRQDILSYHILPWFRKQQENATSGRLRSTDCDQARTILLQWWSTLMNHVQHINHTERSLYFECIVEIIGRSEFVAYDDTSLPFEHWYAPVENSTMATRSLLEEYKYLLMTTLRYAIDKLNYRAIYSNMISFCAKILALGFIKIPGLAITLLQTLPIRNTIMKRIIAELGDLNKHKDFRQNISSVFPRHLHSIMTWRPTQYNIHIQKPKQQQQKSPIASTGNWTRRWQSDDSELFFSFYRHYHVTLKTYVTAVYPTIYKYDLQERNTMLAVSPGYTYLAAYFAGKIDSLLHRRLHSVTTTLQQQPAQLHSSSTTTNSSCPINNHDNSGTGTMSNYTQRTGTTTTANIQGRQGSATTNAIDTSDAIFVEPGERFLSGSNLTANVHQSSVPLPSMLSSQMPDRQPGPSSVHQPTRKPLPLEMATQRYGECLVWCVMVSEPMGLFYDMINIWMRTMIKTTSMMAVESVYCLLDFIEVMILEAQRTRENMSQNQQRLPSPPPPSSSSLEQNKSLPPFDIPFLLYTLQTILSKSDHTITLLRALTFTYTHFDFLVSDTERMDLLCNRILLATPIFERLFLHWSRNVRIFFLRCLVWRLGRIWTKAHIQWSPMTRLLSSSTIMSTIPSKSIDAGSTTTTAAIMDDTVSNTTETLCNGNNCWKALYQHHDVKDVNRLDNHRCSIQVHILLETMLNSFQRRYLELTNQVTPDSPVVLSNSPSVILSDHDLVHSNAYPANSLTISHTVEKEEEKQLQHQQKQKQPAMIKIRRRNSSFKKNHLFVRPITAANKEKWKKLFQFGSSASVFGNNTINHSSGTRIIPHKSQKVDDKTKYGHGFFYTLPSKHNLLSLTNHTNNKVPTIADNTMDGIKSISAIHSLVTTPPMEKGNVECNEKDNGDSDDDNDDDDNDDDDNDDDEGTIDTSPPSSSFMPLSTTFIQTARTWKYMKTRQVYADKTLEELKVVLHEYSLWLEKKTSIKGSVNKDDDHIIATTTFLVSSTDQQTRRMAIPGLILDWPRNWTISQM